MTNKDRFSKYYARSETQRSLNKALHKIATTNLATLSREQLKQIANPIIREAKRRMVTLEKEGLTDSPAYTFLKNELGGKYPSAAGTNINSIRNNVRLAYEFLHTKTSLPEGASEYNLWLSEHLGHQTTKEEREEIWDIVHRFENSHPQIFQGYGYDEAIKKIASAYQISGRDKEKAYEEFTQYLKGTGELFDIEMGTGEELAEAGITPWFEGRNSRRY